MNQITVDTTKDTQFRTAYEPVQVCDLNGEVLGYFTPAAERSIYQSIEPPNVEEELLRRADAGGGRRWSEIRADLEKLA